MQDKLQLLRKKLAAHERLAIAFSGGVDSSLLLALSTQVMGPGALAVTVTGPNFPADEIKDAEKFCTSHEIPQLIINVSDELAPILEANQLDRCYRCKYAIFKTIRESLDYLPIADGTNLDDLHDFRPGMVALKELGVLSPLRDVGLSKSEIRASLRAMNLPVWNKPSCACLASRIPYGTPATKTRMDMVYNAELSLKSLGFDQVRVRHHESIARIEIPKEAFSKFSQPENMVKVNKLIKDIGFDYVCLDLGGYKTGSLNILPKDC